MPDEGDGRPLEREMARGYLRVAYVLPDWIRRARVVELHCGSDQRWCKRL